MQTKRYGETIGVMAVMLFFIAGLSSPALAKWGIDSGWGSGSGKTVPSSSASFTSKGTKSNTGHSWGTHDTETVTADVSGEFNGKAYTKTETKTSTLALHNGKEIKTTSVSYFNDKGQKVGIKSEGGWADREITYDYDAAGNISKEVVVKTTHGWTDKPENGGKEFTRVMTTTSVYTYEDVKDSSGNVTGQKVTKTSTTTREVDGTTRSAGTRERVSVTITDTAGNTISETITSTNSDGSKKVSEYKDGKWKSTFYDKDGKEYVPEKRNYKDVIAEVFNKTKSSAAGSATDTDTATKENEETVTTAESDADKTEAEKTDAEKTDDAADKDYLKATKYAESDNQKIIDLAEKLTAGLTTDKDKAQAIFDYIQENYDYKYYYRTAAGALEMLDKKEGNGADLSHLFVALCRAAGLEARYKRAMVTNAAGMGDGIPDDVERIYAQVKVDGEWLDADPADQRNAKVGEMAVEVVDDEETYSEYSNANDSVNLSDKESLNATITLPKSVQDFLKDGTEIEDDAEDVVDLADKIIDGNTTDSDKLDAIKSYFRRNFKFIDFDNYDIVKYANGLSKLFVAIVRAVGMNVTDEQVETPESLTDLFGKLDKVLSAKIELSGDDDDLSTQTIIPAELVF